MAYILAFARRLPWMDKAMRTGEWQKIPGRSLSECTLGVIGVGAIGKAVIQRAHCLWNVACLEMTLFQFL